MIYLFVAGTAVLLAYGWARRPTGPAPAPALPRALGLVGLTLLLQVAWLRGLSPSPAAASFAWLFPLTYLPLLGFLWRNRALT